MDKVISDHVAWDDWEAWNKLMLMFFTEGNQILSVFIFQNMQITLYTVLAAAPLASRDSI